MIGIGTDQETDYISELRMAGLVSKIASGRADVATAPELVRAATLGGAEALRRPDLGRIAPGARADLIVVDLGRPRVYPARDPLKNLVWHATGADVAAVLVDGELLVKGGVYLRADESDITRRAMAAVKHFWRLAEDAGLLPSAGQDGAEGRRPTAAGA
jgi:cytosine/adenosine deaminase-related metal-dependent hydrolase